MSSQIWLSAYWQAVLDQNAPEMRKYFHEHARISWHNSNECFTTAAFIRANCEYPGAWAGEIPVSYTHLIMNRIQRHIEKN